LVPRALFFETTDVRPGDRQQFLDGVRVRRDAARSAGCNFWVFADGSGGSFIEFVEGRDAASVSAALGAGPDVARIYHEVEIG
jgi:hypothetical protein